MNRDIIRKLILEETYDLLGEDRDYDVDSLPFSLSLMEIYGDMTADQRQAAIDKRAAELKLKFPDKPDNFINQSARMQVDYEATGRKTSAEDEIEQASKDAADRSAAWQEAMGGMEPLKPLDDIDAQPTGTQSDKDKDTSTPAPGANPANSDTNQPTEVTPPDKDTTASGTQGVDGPQPSTPEPTNPTPTTPTVDDSDGEDNDDAPGIPADGNDSDGQAEPETPPADPKVAVPVEQGVRMFMDLVNREKQAREQKQQAAAPDSPSPANESFHRRSLIELLYDS